MASDTENQKQLKRNIIECLRNQEQSLPVFRNLIQNKDVVIFLGNSRSGKSTLVNYIIGNKLEGWESGKMEYKIRSKRGGLGPKIGQGSLSCTTLPGVYKMAGSNDVVVVDPPGFDDNRGTVQEIINALYINQITYARTIKYVLVCDINEITCDNIRNFTNFLNHIQNLVCNLDKLKKSSVFIFTKDWRNYNQAEIITLLRTKILNQDKMDVNKTLLKNLVENEKLIGIFKMPIKKGDIYHEISVNVENAIKECRSVNVERCEIMFTLSDKAREELLETYPEYTDTNYFKEQTDKIIDNYKNYFEIDRYVYASYDGELETTKTNLVQLASNLETHRDANRTHLLQIQNSLDQLLEPPLCSEFKVNFQFVIMLDQSSILEQNYKDMMKTNYVNSLSNLHSNILEVLSKINAEISDRSRSTIIFTTGTVIGILGTVAAGGSAYAGDVMRAARTVPGDAGLIVGVAVAAAGAGAAYKTYKDEYVNRIETRRAQGRPD